MKNLGPLFIALGAGIIGVTTAIAGAYGAFTGKVSLVPYLCAYGVSLVMFIVAGVLLYRHGNTQGRHEGWFSFDVMPQIHPWSPFQLSIRNCGPRPVRNVHFDAITSRNGRKVWLGSIANLAPMEKTRLGYMVGDNAETPGSANHIIFLFEGGSSNTNVRRFPIVAYFLDGNKKLKEQHIIEGQPLSNGGVGGLRIYPEV